MSDRDDLIKKIQQDVEALREDLKKVEADEKALEADVAALAQPAPPPPPAAPKITLFTVKPTEVEKGSTVTLTWATENADSCVAFGDWVGTKAAAGAEVLMPAASAIYGLSCTGPGGTATTDPVTVTVKIPAPPPPPPPPSLHAVLQFADGKVLEFDESAAKDLGDYVGPFVHQRNLRQIASGNGDYRDAFLVDFRPDADGKRDEVVVEFGTLFKFAAGTAPKTASGVAPTDIMQPYVVTITGGNLTAPVTITVPNHFHMARWRWQSAPRPIVQSPDDLVRTRAILPLSRDFVYSTIAPPKAKWSGPMGTGGIYLAMAAPGDRPDIGPETEWFATYQLGSNSYEESWRAGAEATGTMAFWVRDVDTGALVNLSKWQYPAFNDADHSPAPKGQIPIVANKVNAANRIGLDAAHFPDVAFPAAMATDDPYLWEGAQAIANYSTLQSNLNRIGEKIPTLCQVSQPRSWAWGMRNYFQLAGFMPSTTPGWMLSQDYYMKTVLPDHRKFAQKYLDARATPATTVFKVMPFTNNFPSFMLEYQCIVFGWAAWTGKFPDWQPVVEYIATPRIVWSDPTNSDGWDHRLQLPYYMPIADIRKGALAGKAPNSYYNIAPSPDMATSWAELLNLYPAWAQADNDEKKVFVDPSKWPADGLATAISYYPTIRASLAALSLGGVVVNGKTARAGHDWLAAQIIKQARIAGPACKWAIPPVW